MRRATPAVLATFLLAVSPARTEEPRPRARDLGVAPGVFAPGALNAITDVAGVRVGHVTVVEGDSVRTGVTAILPHGGNVFQDKVAGGVFVGNAFGKLAGSTQVEELGTIETPIVLTTTLGVGTAVEAVVDYTLGLQGNGDVRSVNAVVGETNDGWALNDGRGRHVTREHVLAAIRGATEGPVAEGSVGAGTGTVCFGWKGGIGTSSRVVPRTYGGFTVGVLVQTNFGGVLQVLSAPVGRALGRYAFKGDVERERGDGSIMIVVATNAPIQDRNLERLAARAMFGVARTGSSGSNSSGDYVVAFSTAEQVRRRLTPGAPRDPNAPPAPRAVQELGNDDMSPLFQAVIEATEEAIYNSMFMATTVSSRGRTVPALPLDSVRVILARYGIRK